VQNLVVIDMVVLIIWQF